jgi:hypothetical protein
MGVVLEIILAQLQVVLIVTVVLLESSTICLPASSLLSSSGNNSLNCLMNRGIELGSAIPAPDKLIYRTKGCNPLFNLHMSGKMPRYIVERTLCNVLGQRYMRLLHVADIGCKRGPCSLHPIVHGMKWTLRSVLCSTRIGNLGTQSALKLPSSLNLPSRIPSPSYGLPRLSLIPEIIGPQTLIQS